MNREEQISNANPYAGSSDIGFGKMVGFNAGAKWADKHPVSPWIECRNQLPVENQLVLVQAGYQQNIIHLANYHDGEFYEEGEVVHFTGSWMPIPE